MSRESQQNRFLSLLLLIGLLVSPGCERVRQMMTKKPPAKTATSDFGPLVTDLSAGEMESFPKQRGRLAMVDYHADWSGPSKQLAPLLDRIAAEYGGVVVVGKVNFDQYRELAKKEGVKDLPDIRIYRDGVLVDKFKGLLTEDEIRAKVAIYAKGLPPPSKASVAKPVTEPMRKDWMPPGMKRR